MPRDLHAIDPIAKEIVDAAFQVHKTVGPGLLESVYERCLAFELTEKGIPFEKQKAFSFAYKGIMFEEAGRIDLLVDDEVIVEIKSVETVLPVHKAQILSYMKMNDKKLDLLINFNTALIKDGIQRFAL